MLLTLAKQAMVRGVAPQESPSGGYSEIQSSIVAISILVCDGRPLPLSIHGGVSLLHRVPKPPAPPTPYKRFGPEPEDEGSAASCCLFHWRKVVGMEWDSKKVLEWINSIPQRPPTGTGSGGGSTTKPIAPLAKEANLHTIDKSVDPQSSFDSEWDSIRTLINLQVMDHDMFCSCPCLSTPSSVQSHLSRLVSVDLRNFTQLTEIGDHFFFNALSLREVHLPNTLRCVGAFFLVQTCVEVLDWSLTQLENVGAGLLLNNTRLVSIALPPTLREAGSFFLANTTNLERLDLSHTSLTTLPLGSLYRSGIETLLLPPSLEAIDDGCCSGGLRNLGSLDLSSHSNLTRIGCDFLAHAQRLQVLLLPTSLKSLGAGSLCNTGLRFLDLSQTQLKKVESQVLMDCAQLEQVSLPMNVTHVMSDFLRGSTKLKTLDLSEMNKLEFLGYFFLSESNIETISFPPSVQDILPQFLSKTPFLSRVDLRMCTQLEKTGRSFLSECSALTELQLPSSLTLIDEFFLYRVCTLKVLDLSNCTQLKTIKGFFLVEASLEAVLFPSSLETIGKRFLWKASIQRRLDLSNTKITKATVGEFFLADTQLMEGVELPKGFR